MQQRMKHPIQLVLHTQATILTYLPARHAAVLQKAMESYAYPGFYIAEATTILH